MQEFDTEIGFKAKRLQACAVSSIPETIASIYGGICGVSIKGTSLSVRLPFV